MTFRPDPSAIVIEQRFGEQHEAKPFFCLWRVLLWGPLARGRGGRGAEASPPGSSVCHSPCGLWRLSSSVDIGSSSFQHPWRHSGHPEAQLSLWGQGGGHVSSGQTCGGLLIVWLSGLCLWGQGVPGPAVCTRALGVYIPALSFPGFPGPETVVSDTDSTGSLGLSEGLQGCCSGLRGS